jgi:hypothetical protein
LNKQEKIYISSAVSCELEEKIYGKLLQNHSIFNFFLQKDRKDGRENFQFIVDVVVGISQ